MRLYAAILLFAATAAAAEPLPSAGCARTSIEKGRRLTRTVDVGGTKRQVILDVPERVKPGTPAPILLDFHGFGHSGAGVWNVSGFKAVAEREGFITAYPEGLAITLRIRGEEMEGPGWQMDAIAGNRDVAFTTALIDELERDYCVDRRRIYSTGFSNGAFFSHLLACAMAGRIAAVAPVSGGMPRVECSPSRPVPILIQHGTQDELIPIGVARESRDRWRTLDGCPGAPQSEGEGCQRYSDCRVGAVVEYCEEAYAHRWPPQATDRVWQFLSTKSLP